MQSNRSLCSAKHCRAEKSARARLRPRAERAMLILRSSASPGRQCLLTQTHRLRSSTLRPISMPTTPSTGERVPAAANTAEPTIQYANLTPATAPTKVKTTRGVREEDPINAQKTHAPQKAEGTTTTAAGSAAPQKEPTKPPATMEPAKLPACRLRGRCPAVAARCGQRTTPSAGASNWTRGASGHEKECPQRHLTWLHPPRFWMIAVHAGQWRSSRLRSERSSVRVRDHHGTHLRVTGGGPHGAPRARHWASESAWRQRGQFGVSSLSRRTAMCLCKHGLQKV